MDQSRDVSGQQLHRLIQLFPAPDFVKNASSEDLVGEPDMGPELYGDPVHRLYPCHSQAATWVSTAFFLNKRAEFNEKDAAIVDERLRNYAQYHRITNTINLLRTKMAEAMKVAERNLTNDDYALVFTDGVEYQRHYPLGNSEEVKVAADYIFKNRDYYPYTLRRGFADRVLQKAAEHGVKLSDELSDFMSRLAGYGACTAKTAVAMIRNRVKAAQKGPGNLSEVQTEMIKLAETIERYPSFLRAPSARVKLARVVDDYDRTTGINRSYGGDLQRPEDVLFEFTGEKMTKIAEEHITNPMTGSLYRLSDLERVKVADVRASLGDDFADSVAGVKGYIDSEKVAAIIPTMDRGFAGMFDRVMSSLNVLPLAKEASADFTKMSHSYLQNMGREYEVERLHNPQMFRRP